MRRTTLNHRTIGVNFRKDGAARVLVWVPNASNVTLLINDSDKIELQKKERGYWSIETGALKENDLYKFILDGNNAFPDPASLAQPQGVHGPSAAINLNTFTWTDGAWKNNSLNDYILYELHTGTFTPEGTFEAIITKLDHLIELGITAIEIMPVAQFPGDRNWGYDGVFPFAVQHSYGGYEGLKKLVDACHQKGLAVVLDVVYNHLGPEGAYHGAFGPYVTEKYKTPWGGAINFDDAGSDEVRRYVIENVLMWFRDFHIDALRLDAVHAIKDFSSKHILREIREQVDALMQETGRTFYLIVESDLNDPAFINKTDACGYGMNAQWIDEFHHALRVTATGDRSGYYSDFNGIDDLAKAYKDAYVYDGQYSEHRKKTFGVKATANGGGQFVVFSQNHDQVGNRMLGERTSTLVSYNMQKLLAAAVLISPFLPMLFMGEEWSEPHPFQYFVSHTDADLAEAVRNGRKAEFAAFHLQGEAPDPMSKQTFLQSKLQWHLVEEGAHHEMFLFYKKLIQLRKKYPALHILNRENVAMHTLDRQLLLLRRWHNNEQVFCIMNFFKSPYAYVLPEPSANWTCILNSAEPEDISTMAVTTNNDEAGAVLIPGESILIFTNHTH